MATEQDWLLYSDQAYLVDTDVLLVSNAAGTAGYNVVGLHLAARRANNGPIVASGMTYQNAPALGSRLGAFYLANPDIAYGLMFGTNTVDGHAWLQAMRTDGTAASANISLNEAGGAVLMGTTARLSGNTMHEAKTTGASVWPFCANGNDRGILVRNSASGSGYYLYFEYNGGTNNGSIAWSGSSTSYNTSSDHRLKQDLRPLTGCLERIKALPVWDFEWTTTGERGHGFLAHEYGEVVNNGATGTKDGMREEEYVVEPERNSDVLGPDGRRAIIPAVMGKRLVPDYQGVDQSKVTPYLVGAVQEMASMIDELRAEIAALKAGR